MLSLAAAAMLLLASHSYAQERLDQNTPAASQSPNPGAVALPQLGPPSSAPPDAATSDARPSLKPTPLAVHDLSPWSMFLSADPLVKVVMISLAFASFLTWTIFLAKSAKLGFVRWQLRRSLARVSAAGTLSEAQLAVGRSRSVVEAMLAGAIQEVRMSSGISDVNGIKERVASTFSELVRVEARAARQGMGLLATIGATAPFVGLFGTVWGIMNSFIGISKAQTTNLAVVAPGIAEALLATACGLAAAIPAVMMYNYFARATRGYVDLVGRASGAVRRLLSRDLDRAHGRPYARAAE
jgi:biopolymer transport protein ExbB